MDDERALAAHTAALTIELQRRHLPGLGLLFAGLIGTNAGSLLGNQDPERSPIVAIGVLVIVYVVLTPLGIVRSRRIRRYADEHADLLRERPPMTEVIDDD